MREPEIKDRYVGGEDGYCKFINRYGLRAGLEESGSLICQYCTRSVQGIACRSNFDIRDVIGTPVEIESGY